MAMTKGEYRVGIAFNPGADETVGRIKRAAADLIDLIGNIPLPDWPDALSYDEETGIFAQEREVIRLKALAQTAIEDGAMWAVKAATKPPMEV